MVEITKIENQKNKEKFNLFVDGQFYSGVLKETAIANNFFVGKQIEQDRLDAILVESESKQAFNKASDYLATRLHSGQELRLKLIKRGFSKPAVELAINKLKQYRYINDLAFAELFVEANSKLSKQMLSNKLFAKGIDKTIIDKVLQNVSDFAQLEVAVSLTEKYLKNKKFEECKNKLYAYLMRKGFGYETINKAIKKVTKKDIDWE